MPRRRHEERSSSSYSSSPLRTERSASRPRAASSRSRSPQTSSSSSTERSTPRPSSHSPPPKAERSTPRTASHSPPPKTEHKDYSSRKRSTSSYHHDDYYSSSDDGMSFGFIEAIVDAIKSYRTTSKAEPVAAQVANNSGSISCVSQAKAFQDCLDESETEISKCQSFMDIWCKCKKRSVQGSL